MAYRHESVTWWILYSVHVRHLEGTAIRLEGRKGSDALSQRMAPPVGANVKYGLRMRIGELARLTAVPTKTIRYYESIGLLAEPEREANGYRAYDDEAVARLRFIRDAQASGLSLTEIGSILDLRRHGQATCTHVVDLLDRHLSDLDAHIARLQATRRQLATMTERARAMDPTTCTDPARCQTIQPGADLDLEDLHPHPAAHRH